MQGPNDKPMCWKYDKRGIPHLKHHRWKRVDTPDRWDWERCPGCGQMRRMKQGRIL